MPLRFLELALQDLKRGGIVESHRGVRGGYTLARPPDELTVGNVVRLIDGAPARVGCQTCRNKRLCPAEGPCVFEATWAQGQQAEMAVYDATTFRDLLDRSSQ